MPCSVVTLTGDEIQELKALVQKGGKGYRIRHAQTLLKLDQKSENRSWTYDRIQRCIWRFAQYDCGYCKMVCHGRHGSRPQQKKAGKSPSQS